MPTDFDMAEQQGVAERLGFEALLTEISARFINLPADQVDAAIDEAQRRVCEHLDLDLSGLWEWETEERRTILLTHLYRRYEGPPVPDRARGDEFFPWCLAELVEGRAVVLSSVEMAPPEASVDLAAWRHYGLRSALALPLTADGGAMVGVLGFNTMQREQRWSEDLTGRLKLVAQVFTNAILRKRHEQLLSLSEARLSLAAEAAGAGLWSLDALTDQFWVTDRVRELFGFSPDETVTFNRVLEVVHPDDRELVRRERDEALASGRNGYIEYRIVRKDGSQGWLASRGQVRAGTNGRAHLMGATVDISERKGRESAWLADQVRIASTVEIAGLGFYEMGPGMKVAFLDERIREVVGIPPEEDERGREFWLARIHPDDQPKMQDAIREVFVNGCNHKRLEYRYLHPQRGEIWIDHLSHVFSRNADGSVAQTIGLMQDVTERKQREEALKKALEEVRDLRDRLQRENLYLREQMRRDDGHDEISGDSEPMVQMLEKAKRVAPTDATVLITGETGTGKELLAQAIHDMSRRGPRAMIKVNCAALPAPLIEGELFGREKGAYTGAMTKQAGRFEVADGSSIFLDEIGELPLDLQSKLMRVLQDGTFQRLGSNATIKVNTRIIAATNRNLAEMVRAGSFRADLYHRLNVFPIEVPSLRSRVEDIPSLVWRFVQEFNTKMGRSIDSVPRSVMDRLKEYAWPGNVRELRNLIERAVIVSNGRTLAVDLATLHTGAQEPGATLEEVERRHIIHILERTHWRISGPGGAADVLGLIPTTLHSRMKKLGIARPTR